MLLAAAAVSATFTRRLVLGVPAAVTLTVVAAWFFWPRTAINQRSFERIQVGMTLAEVGAILGGPARKESDRPVVADVETEDSEMDPDVRATMAKARALLFQVTMNMRPLRQPMPDPQCWTSNHLMIRVDLDVNERVTSTDALPVHLVEESPLDMLRRWLRL